jgi:hypothetical protein
MKVAVQKVLILKKMWLPDDMIYEILSFLFFDITKLTRRFKNETMTFLKETIVRYEDIDLPSRVCYWGISFFPYANIQINNVTCMQCGNFVGIEICKCTKKI